MQNQLSASMLHKNIKMKIHRTIIFLIDLHGCETWFVTLREGRRRRLFENKMPRKVSGPEKDKVTGERKELLIEPCDLYYSPNIVQVITQRIMKWAECIVCLEERRVAYRVLVEDVWEREHLEDLSIDGGGGLN